MTLEPLALRWAVESGRVCTKSPVNTAADLGTMLPLTQAVPFAYSIADAESAANNCPGSNIASTILKTARSTVSDMVLATPPHS
jgi:hypothetical protein